MILDKLQNHAQQDVASRHYDRHDYLAEKRRALEQWETELRARLAETWWHCKGRESATFSHWG